MARGGENESGLQEDVGCHAKEDSANPSSGGSAGAVGEGQNLDVGFVKQEEPGKKRGSGWTDRP